LRILFRKEFAFVFEVLISTFSIQYSAFYISFDAHSGVPQPVIPSKEGI